MEIIIILQNGTLIILLKSILFPCSNFRKYYHIGYIMSIIEQYYSLCNVLLPFVKRYSIPIFKKESDKCAVLVDTRCLPNLEFVIRQVGRFLDDSWSMIIFTGNLNFEYSKKICDEIGNISVINLGMDSFTINDYNNMLLKEDFWNKINAEHILVFQGDSMLLRYGINDYLDYDYVGAPWPHDSPTVIGNGGLSLRKKSFIMRVFKEYNMSQAPFYMKPEFLDQVPEDVYFSYGLTYLGGNVPSLEGAKKFSVESIPYDNPIGMHQLWHATENWRQVIIDSVIQKR